MNNQDQNLSDIQLLRKKAEEQLKIKQKTTRDPVMETDVKRLLHELQVHQIELEMQNEELRLANETTEAALKKYTMLYDLAPMGYFTLDHNCRICELNFTGAEMLGDRRFSLIDSNFKLFISEDSKTGFDHFFTSLYTTHSKESCVVTLGYDTVPYRKVYIEGIVTGDFRECLLSIIDVSDLKNRN